MRFQYPLAGVLLCASALAQPQPAVDLSGTWTPVFRGATPSGLRTVGFPVPLPYTPAAAQKAKALRFEDDPGARCIPRGTVRQIPGAIESLLDIVQTPGQIFVFFNQRSPKLIIHMDRSEHPRKSVTTYCGDSIGHWDGNTLVVETVGENPVTIFTTPNERTGAIIHSGALRSTERFRKLEDGKVLEVEITASDPAIYTQPITAKKYFVATPGREMPEYVCEEGLQLKGDMP